MTSVSFLNNSRSTFAVFKSYKEAYCGFTFLSVVLIPAGKNYAVGIYIFHYKEIQGIY